jgi:hypothetical protein
MRILWMMFHLQVKALMGTDLLRNQGLWKQGVQGIRDIFSQVETQVKNFNFGLYGY